MLSLEYMDSRRTRIHSSMFAKCRFQNRVFYAAEMCHQLFSDARLGVSCLPSCQSGQENDEDDVAVDDGDYLNEDELAELQRDEENIQKEVNHAPAVDVRTFSLRKQAAGAWGL